MLTRAERKMERPDMLDGLPATAQEGPPISAVATDVSGPLSPPLRSTSTGGSPLPGVCQPARAAHHKVCTHAPVLFQSELQEMINVTHGAQHLDWHLTHARLGHSPYQPMNGMRSQVLQNQYQRLPA